MPNPPLRLGSKPDQAQMGRTSPDSTGSRDVSSRFSESTAGSVRPSTDATDGSSRVDPGRKATCRGKGRFALREGPEGAARFIRFRHSAGSAKEPKDWSGVGARDEWCEITEKLPHQFIRRVARRSSSLKRHGSIFHSTLLAKRKCFRPT